jgi:peptidoglycan/LPS O-acetylase OafA/YrhL
MTAVPAAHLRSLTTLRFVAAVLVLMFHLSLYAQGLDPWGRLAAAGYVGVSFFFVLSGFVLTYSWDVDAGARRFFRRRFARIYPMHLLFIALAMLPFAPTPNWAALPANILLLQSWSPDDAVVRSFSGVSWSLSCEFFFYAVFPLVVRLLWRIRRPLLTAASLLTTAFALGAALQSRSVELGSWLFHLPAFRLVEFLTGALLATAMMRGWVPRVRVRWACLFVVVSYLAVLVLPLAIGYRVEDRWAMTLLMVPSLAILIAVCAHVDLVGAPSPLQGRIFVSLGQWSYAMYMAHPIVLSFTVPLLASPRPLPSMAGCLLVVLTVVGVSFALYAVFERPLERRLRGEGDTRVSSQPGLDTADTEVAPLPVAAHQRPLAMD